MGFRVTVSLWRFGVVIFLLVIILKQTIVKYNQETCRKSGYTHKFLAASSSFVIGNGSQFSWYFYVSSYISLLVFFWFCVSN